jgi:Pectate lyase superfamily protein
MSCGCGDNTPFGGNDAYNNYCNADTPYPIASAESVPSLISNLTLALYGEIQKDVSQGKVVWIIPCDPSNTAYINSLPRNPGEGLMCYFLRYFNTVYPEGVLGIPYGGTGATSPEQAVENLGAVPATRSVLTQTGSGLAGGGDLGDDLELSLANTAVTPGIYGSNKKIPVIHVNSRGQLTEASEVDAEGFAQVDSEVITANAQQTVFNLTTITYSPGTDSLAVYRNGLRLLVGLDYTETNTTTVTLTNGVPAGDQILFESARPLNQSLSGSSVTFLQAGTGAVGRNMQDKARESVSVKDFGAVGNNIADDTAAIQAFFNFLSGGGSGIIPAGTYKITSPLTLIIAPGGFSIQGAGANAAIFAAAATFSSTSPVLSVVTAGTPAGFSLGGFAVQNAGSSSLTGVRFGNENSGADVIVGYQFSSVHDIYCNGFQTLFDVIHCRQISFSRIAGWNPGFLTANTCLKIRQNGKFTADLRFEDCQFVSSKNTGNSCVSILSNVGPYDNLNGNGSCAGIKFRSCDFYAGEKAINMYASNSAWIGDVWFVDGCQIDQEVVNCVYVEADGSASVVEDVHFDGMYLNKATSPQMVFTSTGTGGQIKSVFVSSCVFHQGQNAGVLVYGPACSDFHVFENTFVDQNNPTGACIEFNSARSVSVNGNRARRGLNNWYSAYLIAFTGTTQNITAIGNDAAGIVLTSVVYDTTGDVKKIIEHNIGLNPLGEAAMTVGTSPFSYKNTTGWTQLVWVQGGTVSSITINGLSVAYSSTGQVYTLTTGSTIIVTYSVAPAMYQQGI